MSESADEDDRGNVTENIRIAEAIRSLGDLCQATGLDWNLDISISLTEPTCPHAVVRPDPIYKQLEDDWYIGTGDTIEQAVEKAVRRARAELIEGRTLGDALPVTNRRNPKLVSTIAKWREKNGLPPLALGGVKRN
jgi:hypothetical protein